MKQVDGPDGIYVETQDVNWHKLQGRRFLAYDCIIQAGLTITVVLILCIALEPDSFETCWFERRASVKRRVMSQQRGRQPPLCDLAWEHTSPVIRCLQYYSWLLTGEAGRLRMLSAHDAYDYWEAWCHVEPAKLDLFCIEIFCLASENNVRHIQNDFSTAWLAAGLVDPRREQSDKDGIAASLVELWKRGLVDEWFLKVFMDKFIRANVEAFFLMENQAFVWHWAWAILGSVVACEYQHGRHRARAHAYELWHRFVAHSMNQ